MPVHIEYEPNDICVLRISGVLKQSEFAAEQSALANKIDTGSRPRLLVILETFEGWERGAAWGNDLEFLFSHSGKISKIAIVAEARWETLALAFAGAGVRRAPVSSFRLMHWSKREAGWQNNVAILISAAKDTAQWRRSGKP